MSLELRQIAFLYLAGLLCKYHKIQSVVILGGVCVDLYFLLLVLLHSHNVRLHVQKLVISHPRIIACSLYQHKTPALNHAPVFVLVLLHNANDIKASRPQFRYA